MQQSQRMVGLFKGFKRNLFYGALKAVAASCLTPVVSPIFSSKAVNPLKSSHLRSMYGLLALLAKIKWSIIQVDGWSAGSQVPTSCPLLGALPAGSQWEARSCKKKKQPHQCPFSGLQGNCHLLVIMGSECLREQLHIHFIGWMPGKAFYDSLNLDCQAHPAFTAMKRFRAAGASGWAVFMPRLSRQGVAKRCCASLQANHNPTRARGSIMRAV